MSKVGETANKREANYLLIDKCVRSYGYRLEDLGQLIAELKGNPLNDEKGVDSAEPSFVDVLHSTPARMDEHNSRLSKLIDDLRDLLY